MEIEIWEAIENICDREGMTVHELFSLIEPVRLDGTSRTSSIRAFTILYFKMAADTARGKPITIPGILPAAKAAE